MPVRDSLHARHSFIHARVVLHGARAQRIHAQVDRVIPRREPGEMANDFDLTDFGHASEVFSFGRSEKLRRIDFRYIERWQFPRGFARRGLFEDQAFILIDVAGGFANPVLHRATSSTRASSLVDGTDPSLSAT